MRKQLHVFWYLDRFRRFGLLQTVHRLHHEEKNRRNDEKIDGSCQELAVAKNCAFLLGISIGDALMNFTRQG